MARAITCKRCDTPGLGWAKSLRTGKWYLSAKPGVRIPHLCDQPVAPIAGASDAPQPTPTAPLKPQAASRRASRPTTLPAELQARLQAATATQEAR